MPSTKPCATRRPPGCNANVPAPVFSDRVAGTMARYSRASATDQTPTRSALSGTAAKPGRDLPLDDSAGENVADENGSMVVRADRDQWIRGMGHKDAMRGQLDDFEARLAFSAGDLVDADRTVAMYADRQAPFRPVH